jgi:hypothetical protein
MGELLNPKGSSQANRSGRFVGAAWAYDCRADCSGRQDERRRQSGTMSLESGRTISGVPGKAFLRALEPRACGIDPEEVLLAP